MIAQSINATNPAGRSVVEDLTRAAAAMAAGWRAPAEWRRLGGRRSGEQVAREIFEHNFA